MKIPTLSEILRSTITLSALALLFKIIALTAPERAIPFTYAANGVLFGIAGMLLIAAIVKLWSKRAS